MLNFYILKQTFKIAWKNIMADKFRTLLTCLGIIIGTSSLIMMMTILDIRSKEAAIEKEASGKYNISITTYGKVLTDHQLDKFRKIPNVAAVSPVLEYYDPIPVECFDQLCKQTYIYGMSNEYFEYSKGFTFSEGTAFSPADVKNGNYVCVINENLKAQFSTNRNMIGESILAFGIPFRIIGICSGHAESPDDFKMYIPSTTMNELTGHGIDQFIIFPKYPQAAESIHLEATKIIQSITHQKQYEGYYNDFSIDSIDEGMNGQAGTLFVQIAVATIALLIGGIGIMNMMLVMVSERTAEIGLRKALGATPDRIQLQFILESLVLSLGGGIVGGIVGILFSLGYCLYEGKDLWINIPSILAGLIFSVAVGVFFGYSPAKAASKLNPIDALKEE